MTAILLDQYKDDLYLFADGRLTGDDSLISNCYEKILHVTGENISVVHSFAGDGGADMYFRQFLWTGTTPYEVLSNFCTDKAPSCAVCGFVIFPKDNAVYHVQSLRDCGNQAMLIPLPLEHPYTSGSGEEILLGAYHTVQPRKAKSEVEYVRRISRCFSAVSVVKLSVGPLYSFAVVSSNGEVGMFEA